MNTLLLSLAAVVVAYLLGSLSFAVIVSRVMGLSDPRSYGSKNPGATNVLRSGSKVAAVLTLLLDAVKGWLPVAWVAWQGPAYGLQEATLALVGLAAFVGHLWPVFFRFAGGKGVATALGVLLGISGWLGLFTLLCWVLVVALFRYSSLAALLAAVFAPFAYLLGDGLLWYSDARIGVAISAMSALLVWRHRENISRLAAGQETRLGSKGKEGGKAGAQPSALTGAAGAAAGLHPVGGAQSKRRKAQKMAQKTASKSAHKAAKKR